MNELTLDELREKDNELVLTVLKESIKKMCNTYKVSPLPRTMEAMITIMINTNSMKDSVFTICANSDAYSAGILYRCIIEHYLRHSYLFFRANEERNDEVGIEFFEFGDIREQIEYYRIKQNAKKTFHETEETIDIEGSVLAKYPRYWVLTKEQLRQKFSQLSIRAIVNFIWSELKDFTVEPAIWESLVSDYSILSSFVHGGIYANQTMKSYGNNEQDIEKELLKLAKQSYYLSAIIKMNTYITASRYDSSFLSMVPKIKEYVLNLD